MSVASPPELPPTRRQRGRASAIEEIKAAALDELRCHGPGGVTMRGVARAIDMTPSGLYRYFDDHGALLAALCVDARNSLRTTLEESQARHTDDDTMTQWFRGSVVMRQWALDHVDEYALVVGPRPSGVDPDHPELAGATVQLVSIPVENVARAISSGDLLPAPVPASVAPLSMPSAPGGALVAPGAPGQARTIAVGAVSALVGAVSLEAFGHLTGTDRGDAYAAYSLQVMRAMGFVRTSDLDVLALAAS
jgi:AcrR family transcriptional regulator